MLPYVLKILENMEYDNNKSKHLRLVNIISDLELNNSFIEDEGYKRFVINNLKSIIDKCSNATNVDDIVKKYYQVLISSDKLTIKYLLIFLQKHQLIDFYTYYFPGRLYTSIKEDLDLLNILEAYENEVVSVQKEVNNHMKIILGSKNESKKEALELALNSLNIKDFVIECLEVPSHVSSKPINDEAVLGAHNRNQEILDYCLKNEVSYDLLISIEGGYEQVEDYYFIVTYASIIDKNGNEYVGKSQGLQITKSMFELIKKGESLNAVIEEILDIKENKKGNGISGYLTNGYYYRNVFDSTSIISAFQSMNNYERYNKLERKINPKKF